MRILLADDQPQVRSALRLLLEYDLKVQIVGEVVYAEDLLARVETTQPEVLLLDWELPGLLGEEMLPRLQQNHPDLAVIALSGRPEAEPIALALGADGFISKGHPAEHLLKILRDFGVENRTAIKNEIIKDWMTAKVITVASTGPLSEAQQLMAVGAIHRLPVMQDGQLCGIITLEDVLEAKTHSETQAKKRRKARSALSIAQVMSPNPICISYEKTVGQAAWLMQQHKIGGLPVVDEQGQLVGIITASDIFRVIVHRWSEGIHRPEITTTTPNSRFLNRSRGNHNAK
jgi:CBS domain-containing protein